MERYVALYTKYRPLTFDDMVGQEAPIAALRQSVRTGKIGHAYLFCGQRGTGKTTIARIFSRAVNCLNPVNGNPCNKCASCKAILDGSSIDVIEIDGASNNSVDNVRKICEDVTFAPSQCKYKVYIIDEVHMITGAGFNALLKTLEEPPEHAIFLFATTEMHLIKATILSRCLRFQFKRIPVDLMARRLRVICDGEGIKYEENALLRLAQLSDGALRDAITNLDQVAVICDGRNEKITDRAVEDILGVVDTDFLFKMSNALLDGKMEELLDLLDTLHKSGRNLIVFTTDLANYFRDLLIIRLVPNPMSMLPYPADVIKQMYLTASHASPETLTGFIQYLYNENAALRKAGVLDANFDILMIRLCGRKAKLEVPPLTMPDFGKLQAEAAKNITIPKAEQKKEEKPSLFTSSFTSLGGSLLNKDKEEKKEDKPEEKKSFLFGSAPAVKTEESSLPLKEETPLKLFSADDDREDKAEDTKEPEPAPAPAAVVEEAAAEDKPLTNQISLFDAPEEKPAEKVEEKKEDTSDEVGRTLSHLSDSFLDDLMPRKEEKAEEPAPDPEEDRPVRKSSVAAAYDNGGLVVSAHNTGVREANMSSEGAEVTYKWENILKQISSNLAEIMRQAELKFLNNCLYAVFEDRDKQLLANIRTAPDLKKVSDGAKEQFGVEKFYLAIQSQYSAAEKKAGADLAVEQTRQNQEAIVDIAKQMDIPIKFGDEE